MQPQAIEQFQITAGDILANFPPLLPPLNSKEPLFPASDGFPLSSSSLQWQPLHHPSMTMSHVPGDSPSEVKPLHHPLEHPHLTCTVHPPDHLFPAVIFFILDALIAKWSV